MMIEILKSFSPIKNNEVNVFWIGFFLFILAITYSWFGITLTSIDILKIYFASLGFSLLMILGLFRKSRTSNIHIKINAVKLSLFLLFTLGSISIIWSINSDFAISKWLLWIICAFSFIVSLNITTTNQNLINLALGLIISASAIAIIGLFQHFSNPFASPVWPPSTFGNKNFATQVLVLIFPISFFLLFSKKIQGYSVWFIQFASSLIITYVILTFTRAAWIAVSFELLLIFLYLISRRSKVIGWINWNKNKRNAFIVSLLFILFLLNLSAPNQSESIWIDIFHRVTFTASSSDISSINRFEIWQNGLRMFLDRPFFGSGLGSFSQNLANEGYATAIINNSMRAHNDIIELLVELGLIGLLVFFSVVISLIMGVFLILKKTSGESHLFFLFISIGIIGSFINLQFSFPYQLAFPLLLFGLYSGLIANQLDRISNPLYKFEFFIKSYYKKIILFSFSVLLSVVFFLTHVQTINFYHQLDKIVRTNDFSKLNDIENSFNNNYIQSTLYHVGGKNFNKGNFFESKQVDQLFLKVWPNHIDVLYRLAFAEHRLGQNEVALSLVKKLKEIEPEGLYNGYIVEMFIYLDENKIIELEQIFKELMLKPKELLGINENTYRMMIFFTLSSKELSHYAPSLYSEYLANSHKYIYKSNTYSSLRCEVENNMAIHYFNLESYQDSANIVNKVSNNDNNCFNPDLLKLLNKMNLLSI